MDLHVVRLRAKSCACSLDGAPVRFANVRNAGTTAHGFRVSSEAAKLLEHLSYKFVEFIVLYLLEYRKLVISNSDKRSEQTVRSKVIHSSFFTQLSPL